MNGLTFNTPRHSDRVSHPPREIIKEVIKEIPVMQPAPPDVLIPVLETRIAEQDMAHQARWQSVKDVLAQHYTQLMTIATDVNIGQSQIHQLTDTVAQQSRLHQDAIGSIQQSVTAMTTQTDVLQTTMSTQLSAIDARFMALQEAIQRIQVIQKSVSQALNDVQSKLTLLETLPVPAPQPESLPPPTQEETPSLLARLRSMWS